MLSLLLRLLSGRVLPSHVRLQGQNGGRVGSEKRRSCYDTEKGLLLSGIVSDMFSHYVILLEDSFGCFCYTVVSSASYCSTGQTSCVAFKENTGGARGDAHVLVTQVWPLTK